MKTASLISPADGSVRWLGLDPLQADRFDVLSTTALTSQVFALGAAPAGGSETPAPLWSTAAPAGGDGPAAAAEEVTIVTGDSADGATTSDDATSAGPSGGGDLLATSTVGEGSAAAADAGGNTVPDPLENTDSTGSGAIGASGSQQLDGILSGSRWTGNITYAAGSTAGGYSYTYDADGDTVSVQNEGFGQVSASQLIAIHFALNDAQYTQPAGAFGFAIEGFTNANITYNGVTNGASMRFANSTDPGTAYAWNPGANAWEGDVWFGGSGRNPFAGNYDWHTVLHETGHAMGLSHGHTGGAYGPLPAGYDGQEFSVMTYKSYVGSGTGGYGIEDWSYPQTYMMLDLLALQWMYGIDYTSRSGADIYKWTPSDPDTYINGVRAIDTVSKVFLTIWDGGGNDTYDLRDYTTNITAYMYSAGYVNLGTQLADLGYYSVGAGVQMARGNIFNSWSWNSNPTGNLIENIWTGTGHDYVVGNEVANSIYTYGGVDTVYGGAGTDTIVGGAGFNFLYGDADGDGLYGGDDGNYMYGGTGGDGLYGGNAGDSLYGGDQDDYLYGYGGADSLYGGDGVDYMYGGADNDTMSIDFGSTGHVADGGSGNDTISFYYSPGGWVIDLVSQVASISNLIFVTLSSVESASGGQGNDTIYGGSADSTLTGNNGADTIYGDVGADNLYGGDDGDGLYGGVGLDFIYGGGGGDYITGGAGGVANGDAMYGGDGADTLQDTSNDFADYFAGGNGADSIYAGGKNDIAYGDADGDLIYAGGGGDAMYGGAGADSMFGEAGNDTMHGDADGDLMYGGADTDTMYGDGGADYLFGDIGSDSLYGGTENDVINSFNQNDNIYGGAGSDWFAFQVNFGVDSIHDWQDAGANQDVIMITSAIFANYATIQSHMSQFNGTTVFINAGGGYGIYVVGATVASLDAGDFYIF